MQYNDCGKQVKLFKPSRLILISALLCGLLAQDIARAQAATSRLPNHVYAEVAGVLHFQDGQGYFISVKNDEFNTENQIWLRISEDKSMVSRLQRLTNKEVIARGSLGQMPDTVNSAVPKGGMYLGDISFIDGSEEGARAPE
jgi:hypothetical protein